VHYPNEVVACKRGSPLLVGLVARNDSALLQRNFSVTVRLPSSCTSAVACCLCVSSLASLLVYPV
jgi:hypothetical protein